MIVDKIELDEDEKSQIDINKYNLNKSLNNESKKKIEKVNIYIIYTKKIIGNFINIERNFSFK